MSIWSTISKIGKVRLAKVRQGYRLVAEILESLTDEQKASIMAMATPEQLQKGMELYGIWQEIWSTESEEKK